MRFRGEGCFKLLVHDVNVAQEVSIALTSNVEDKKH